MRPGPTIVLIALFAAGCGGDGRATNLLCDFCTDDSQCGGNPCFADASGGKYCGRSCSGGCPTGFSCLGITGTAGATVESCFPNNQLCSQTMVPGSDMAMMPPPPGSDLSPPPTCMPPAGGSVSLSGGTVDRLYFGYTGDTRDTSSTSSYSSTLQATINNIYTQMGTRGVEFALDGGDHMEASTYSEAKGNMANYLSATALLGKPVFMTLGNHECSQSFSGPDCGGGEIFTDRKGQAFMEALSSSIGATQPYYRFDVMTNAGKAVFIVVADDAWDSTQQTWLTQQLTDADSTAKYTFVTKHHPNGNTDMPSFQTIYDLVRAHKYTLFLTSHSHEYKRQFGDPHALVMGLGGAPFDNPKQQWWGYLTAMQCPDDHIYVSVYDQATGNVMDSFNVPPQ
jgi:hypothetical protein